MEIWDKNIVNWPSKLRGNLDLRDRKKYYCFYHDHGFDTKECETLKDEIEMLIKRDYLSKYKKEYRAEKLVKWEQAEYKPVVQELSKPTNRIINELIGGITTR